MSKIKLCSLLSAGKIVLMENEICLKMISNKIFFLLFKSKQFNFFCSERVGMRQAPMYGRRLNNRMKSFCVRTLHSG